MRLITLIGAGVLMFSTAFIIKKTSSKQMTFLYKTNWSLKKLHTESGTEEANTKVHIKFDKEKQRAGGNGSCNSFGGSFFTAENKIHINNIISTKMDCDSIQKTENIFFDLLGKVNRFETKAQSLLLYSDKDLLLEFTSE